MNRGLSLFCKIFLKPIIDRFLVKEVKGSENVPKTNFILAANHQSHLDQIFTAYICVPRRFHMMGQVDRYNQGIIRILRDIIYSIAGVIPLNRKNEESKKRAAEEAVNVLQKGDILIIYPEGTRTRSGEMGKGKLGIAKIFLRTVKPILPVGIKGTFELLPPGRAFPKIKKIVEIKIGNPLYFKEEFQMVKNLDCYSQEYQKILQKITEKTMEEIKKLVCSK